MSNFGDLPRGEIPEPLKFNRPFCMFLLSFVSLLLSVYFYIIIQNPLPWLMESESAPNNLGHKSHRKLNFKNTSDNISKICGTRLHLLYVYHLFLNYFGQWKILKLYNLYFRTQSTMFSINNRCFLGGTQQGQRTQRAKLNRSNEFHFPTFADQ